jgi:hypothetical protein
MEVTRTYLGWSGIVMESTVLYILVYEHGIPI